MCARVCSYWLDDARYSQYAGRQAINPLTGRAIPIVTDRMVDIELGSGVVKVVLIGIELLMLLGVEIVSHD